MAVDGHREWGGKIPIREETDACVGRLTRQMSTESVGKADDHLAPPDVDAWQWGQAVIVRASGNKAPLQAQSRSSGVSRRIALRVSTASGKLRSDESEPETPL